MQQRAALAVGVRVGEQAGGSLVEGLAIRELRQAVDGREQFDSLLRARLFTDELLHQPAEIRIGAPVVNDETGIDAEPPAALGQVDGVGMAPDPVLGLVDRQVVPTRQQMRDRQARDARAHDGDALTHADSFPATAAAVGAFDPFTAGDRPPGSGPWPAGERRSDDPSHRFATK